MKEFRKGEFLNLLNKQYSGMQLTEPRKVKENSVVLIRNIANESKREPMKFARIVKINDSRDDSQRILTLKESSSMLLLLVVMDIKFKLTKLLYLLVVIFLQGFHFSFWRGGGMIPP